MGKKSRKREKDVKPNQDILSTQTHRNKEKEGRKKKIKEGNQKERRRKEERNWTQGRGEERKEKKEKKEK